MPEHAGGNAAEQYATGRSVATRAADQQIRGVGGDVGERVDHGTVDQPAGGLGPFRQPGELGQVVADGSADEPAVIEDGERRNIVEPDRANERRVASERIAS